MNDNKITAIYCRISREDELIQESSSIETQKVYLGHIICNRHQTSSFKSKKLKVNLESEWIINKGIHEPIIDETTFNEVQILMKQKKKTYRVPHENIFKDRIRCNECCKTLSLSIRPDKSYHKSFACLLIENM